VNEIEHTRSSAEEDARAESAVLLQVLALHPTAVTLDELTRELGGDGDAFADRDAIERAVRDLAGAGLVHEGERFVLPTRAALRFDELLGE
jgi:hypothetical protein